MHHVIGLKSQILLVSKYVNCEFLPKPGKLASLAVYRLMNIRATFFTFFQVLS